MEQTVVERIRELCKEKGITVHALESSLGYGNGYLNPKKTTDIRGKRLIEIANYLGVSAEYLASGNGEVKKNNAAPQEEDDGMLEMLEAIRDNYALRMLFEEAVKLPKSKILETLAIIEKNKETEIDY